MKYPKVREIVEAARALVKGPYTSSFPGEPHEPHPAFRGQPRFDPDLCLGCLACEEVCPAAAIAHEDRLDGPGPPHRIMYHYTDSCIFCGQCEDACINDHRGIRLSRDWELSFFDRNESFESIEKPLQLCEACGETIGCVDHLLWIARRLSARSFSSPTLYLTWLRALGAVDDNLVTPAREDFRSDRFKILCARCRRRTAVADGQS
jgi:hydrogenase-4 component H